MNTRHRRSCCRRLFTASPRPATAPQPVALPGVVDGRSAINLAELARIIASDRHLCCRIVEAAIEEFGWPGLSVEQAIVLLGWDRLASQFLRLPHIQRLAPAGNLCPTEPFQREQEPGESE